MQQTYSAQYLYEKTALSRQEIKSIEAVRGILSFFGDYAFVGNVGIKVNISPHHRRSVDMSRDLDIIVFDEVDEEGISKLLQECEGIQIKKENLTDENTRRFGSNKVMGGITYSPFYVIHAVTGSTTIDIFTYYTGIGPILIKESDKEHLENQYGLPVMDVGFLLASNLNPRAITGERIKRVSYMLESKWYSARNATTLFRKIVEAINSGNISPEEFDKVVNMLENSHRRGIFYNTSLIDTVNQIRRTFS